MENSERISPSDAPGYERSCGRAPVDNITLADTDPIQRIKMETLLEQDRAYAGQTGKEPAIEAAISI
jgi:hypothetical protein